MNGEQDESKEPGRHISMELTADSARVTSLSLQGSRLVVTIEAELADSQVHAAARTGKKCPKSEAAEASTRLQRRDTEIVRRAAATSPAGGPAAAPDVPEGASSFAMGSESLRPAPAAYAPVTNDPHNPAFDDPAATLPDPALYFKPAPSDTQPIAGMGAPAEAKTDAVHAVAPPLEPVRELTDTWDEPGAANRPEAVSPGFVQEPWSDAAPVVPAAADEQDLKETAADEAVYGSESARQWTEPAPVTNDPHNPAFDAPVTPPPVAPAAPAPSVPVTNDPHNPAFDAPAVSQIPAPADEPLAITEESSAIGGERHGEPQPTFSYGGLETIATPIDLVPPPAPEPEPAALPPAPAPAPEAPQGETGGTTVLIRYTCPKCKTQGMQAVDKVGTVVNCSNCGKAMRLVMKK